MESWLQVFNRVKPFLGVIFLQFGYAGFHVVSRAALNMGISKIVFPVYRNILAFLLLVPFAFFLEKYVVYISNNKLNYSKTIFYIYPKYTSFIIEI